MEFQNLILNSLLDTLHASLPRFWVKHIFPIPDAFKLLKFFIDSEINQFSIQFNVSESKVKRFISFLYAINVSKY